MFQSQLPKHFWSYTIKHAFYLINHIPSLVTKKQTPYELLHNQKPDFSMLKVFGSLCYASTTGPKQKFDFRSRKGVFLGYQFGTKGYIILDLQNKDIFVSRDVIFYESHFPFNNKLEAQEKEKLFPPQTKTFHDIDPLQLTPHHNNFTP